MFPRRKAFLILTTPTALIAALMALSLSSCQTPLPDYSRQKVFQVAVILGYRHPAAHRAVAQGLELAQKELSQLNAVLFSGPELRPLSKRERRAQSRRDARNPQPLNYSLAQYQRFQQQQIGQIIAEGYDALVVFGDELLNLDESLLEAQRAGLLVIYCGFASRPIVGHNSLSQLARTFYPSPSPAVSLHPDQSILNETAQNRRPEPRDAIGLDRGAAPALAQEDLGSLGLGVGGDPGPSGGPLPYIDANSGALEEGPDSELEGQETLPKQEELPGLVHLNLMPMSLSALLQEALPAFAARPPLAQQSPEKGSVLLLFGPANRPFTRRLYRSLQPLLQRNLSQILAVRFLDPQRMDTAQQIRELLGQLPAQAKILIFEPLLFASTAQIAQRYGSSAQITGLGWEELLDPLIASGSARVISLHEDTLAYAAMYTSFALLSGQKQGLPGEHFLLGNLGQREVDTQGSLTIQRSSSIQVPQSLQPEERELPTPRRPSYSSRNPRRSSILSENDPRRRTP